MEAQHTVRLLKSLQHRLCRWFESLHHCAHEKYFAPLRPLGAEEAQGVRAWDGSLAFVSFWETARFRSRHRHGEWIQSERRVYEQSL